jgi:hypothetical protein
MPSETYCLDPCNIEILFAPTFVPFRRRSFSVTIHLDFSTGLYMKDVGDVEPQSLSQTILDKLNTHFLAKASRAAPCHRETIFVMRSEVHPH